MILCISVRLMNSFESLITADDKIAIWDFLLKKSAVYRKNNALD